LSIRDASEEETTVLKKNTLLALGSEHDFVILPLEPNTVEVIAREILPRVGLRHRVWHIQIEKHGELQFASYDNFQDAVVVGNAIDNQLLIDLIELRALRSYQQYIS